MSADDHGAAQVSSGRRRLAGAVRQVDRTVATPLVRAQIQAGLAPRAFALLETTGRRTGQARLTPVGNGLEGDTFWLVAQRGLEADYVRNLRADPRVRVKVGQQWRTGTARVLEDDDPWTRLASIAERHGRIRRMDARLLERAIGWYGTTPVTVRIDLDPPRGSADPAPRGESSSREDATGPGTGGPGGDGLGRKLAAYRAVAGRARTNQTDLLRRLVRRPALLGAVAGYETAVLVSGKLPPRLKTLAGVKAAALIGCPL